MDFIGLQLYVAKSGFEIVFDATNGEHFLVPKSSEVDDTDYLPLDKKHSGLFRRFAATPLTSEAVVVFANQYGWLGSAGLHPVTDADGQTKPGEPLKRWLQEIYTASKLVTIWELVRNRKPGKLKRYIHWVDHEHVEYKDREEHRSHVHVHSRTVTITPPRIPIASPEKNAHLLKQWPHGVILQPALTLLRESINKQILRSVFPELHSANDILQLRYVSRTLHAAVWYEFAMAIAGNREYAQCPRCERWFEVKHKNRRYCSDACKLAAYRKRKEVKQ